MLPVSKGGPAWRSAGARADPGLPPERNGPLSRDGPAVNIKGSTVLILGGGGMVGRAACRELLDEEPARIVVASIAEAEAQAAITEMQEEHRRKSSLRRHPLAPVEFIPEWGNIFVRASLSHLSFNQILDDPESRRTLVQDTFAGLDDEHVGSYFLYQMVTRHRPDIVLDAINTATGVAYSDVFGHAREVIDELYTGPGQPTTEKVERLLCSIYVPQLLRHMDVLFRAMRVSGTRAYVKVGTSGTGGMGWNIPYTHGEDRPSQKLLSKAAVAGAQSLLLFLQARTPLQPPAVQEEDTSVAARQLPLIKEIKPTATIAWREIGFGDIRYRGQPLHLEEVSLAEAEPLTPGEPLQLVRPGVPRTTEEVFRSAYVNTGENGLFSAEEFVTITSLGQMEFVTPEEIARNIVDELQGVNTGKDVIGALNVTTMNATYRAGILRDRVLRHLRALEAEHGTDSVAFELLGPPRLSKLLYEAYLLKRCFGNMEAILQSAPEEMARRCRDLLSREERLLRTMLSIGIPVLLQEAGELRLARGHRLKSPPHRGQDEVPCDPTRLEQWAAAGWVDLRPSNMEAWHERLETLLAEVQAIPEDETSSRYTRDRQFWSGARDGQGQMSPGEIVAWIFGREDKGERGR